jgi:hypothetical protein
MVGIGAPILFVVVIVEKTLISIGVSGLVGLKD